MTLQTNVKNGEGKTVITNYIDENGVKKGKAEINRLVSMANKRLQRLENAGLQSSPAYAKWLETGGEKFSVRGKNHNELQKEISRLKKFIDSETSTIRGVNSTLKEMAKNTGVKYENLKDLRAKAPSFFTLASKVEQYLRTVEDMASAIGYQKIWEAINQYVKTEEINLGESENDIDNMVQVVSDMLSATNNKDGGVRDWDGWWYV